MTNERKGIIGAIIAVIVMFCIGYGTGRYAAPDKVVTTEKIVTVTQDHVVTQVDTDKIINAFKALNTQKDVHTVRVIEKEKDGTTKITVTQDDKSKSEATTQVQDKEKAQTVKVEDHIVYKDREITKTVEKNRPSWGLSLQPGFELGTVLGAGPQPYNLLSKALPGLHVMANVTLERRFLGPIFLGAWANTHMDAGLSLRLEF